MVISRLHRPLSLTLATLGLITLVACGGGGGGSNPPPVATDDTTPNAFSFTATEGAEPNAVITSPAATVSGINTSTPISISGGEYSIAGGAFTSTAGTITNGQSLVVRLTASDKTNTAKAVTVTVGGVSATFNVTTLVDITADAFSFTAITGAELNKEYTSEAITVSGIDVAVSVSVSGGLYSINGSEFTSAASTVSAGQTITLKATSGNNTDTTQNAVLSVGSISGTFAVTTIPDTTPPVAEFKFPTPYTMSEANTVKVRGTATDDHAIKSVKVVVTNNLNATLLEIPGVPKTEGDFSSWTAAVPLTALAENEIKVVAKDYRDNEIKIADANKVVIRQADVKSAFPDEVNEFDVVQSSTFKNVDGAILVADSGKVMAVDSATGQRTVFIDHASNCDGALYSLTTDYQNSRLYGVCNSSVLQEYNIADGNFIGAYSINPLAYRSYGFDMALDKENGRNRLVLVEGVSEFHNGGGRVLGFSLDTKIFSVISEIDEQPIIADAFSGIAIVGDSFFITSGGQQEDISLHSIIKVDALTGKHELYSSNTTGSGEAFGVIDENGNIPPLTGIVMDKKNSRFIVMETFSSKLISLDINTGERSLFKDISYIGTEAKAMYSLGLGLSLENSALLISDIYRRSIIMVDLETREKVILSKSKNHF